MNDWFILSDVAEGIPVDSQQLVNLVCCTQLFLRELRKCHCLVESNPMEMTAFYGKHSMICLFRKFSCHFL